MNFPHLSCKILIIGLIIFASGCSNERNSDRVFAALNETLIKSNVFLAKSNKNFLNEIEDNLHNARTQPRAMEWEPKAVNVQQESDHICAFINSLLNSLDMGNANLSNENCDTLYQNIYKYGNELNMLSLDFNHIAIDSIITGTKPDFYKGYFLHQSNVSAKALLNKLKSNILQIENKLLEYCYYHSKDYLDSFTKFSVLIGQSTNIVEQGKEIEIEAGVGEYSREGSPVPKQSPLDSV